MAISLSQLNKKNNPKPPIIMAYGTHGMGKTSFGASAPNPFLIATEDGLGKLQIDHIQYADNRGFAISYAEIMDTIAAIYNEENEYKTLIVDSLDHMEPLIWQEVCERNGWASIEQPGYGKGYVETLAVWGEFFEAVSALRNDRGMIIYMIAHAQIEKFESPETESYDRYSPKLHKKASALVQEKADIVFFVNQRASVVESKDKKSLRAGGQGPRTLFSERRPAYEAKNRYNLPHEIPMGGVNEMAATWENILNCVYN